METNYVLLSRKDVETVRRTLEGLEEMLKVIDNAGKIRCSDMVHAAQEARLILQSSIPMRIANESRT